MKQFLKLFIFQIILFKPIICENYEKFFKEYNFNIFSGKNEVGYIRVSISSFIANSDGNAKMFSEIDSYTDIPI
ncbi:MAG: hypothetical protein N2505_05625, partial [Endomicrobia bacterium]|nr:hypothetical protein [Endomicrobiia bacterium]